MEIICINSVFPPDKLAFFRQHGITLPTEGSIYNVRDMIVHTAIGEKGLLLEEIRNKKVEQVHPVLGKFLMEPTWHHTRFSHLDGTTLRLEELTKIKSKV